MVARNCCRSGAGSFFFAHSSGPDASPANTGSITAIATNTPPGSCFTIPDIVSQPFTRCQLGPLVSCPPARRSPYATVKEGMTDTGTTRARTLWLGYGACALAGCLWGTGFFFGRIAMNEMSVEYMVLYRFFFACLGLLPVAIRNRV